MLEAFPKLPIVLAHMGGAIWEQVREIAASIKSSGPRRVMMGSDYRWYDLDHIVERAMDLPLLAQEEKEAILGANAVNILGL